MSAKALPAVTETTTSTILLTMCYVYQTQASATICLDTDLEHKETNKACTLGPVNLGGGQGAPIAVTRVEETMTTSADRTKLIPMFSITIDNVGGGQVVSPDKIAEACRGRAVESTNKATVHAYLVDQELTCAKEGTAQVSFEPGRNVVRCSLPSGIDKTRGSFNSLLRVQVDYGYSTTLTRQAQIVRGR